MNTVRQSDSQDGNLRRIVDVELSQVHAQPAVDNCVVCVTPCMSPSEMENRHRQGRQQHTLLL